MSNQFKPGDLALTIAPGCDWPAGVVVTVIDFVKQGESRQEPCGFRWWADWDQYLVMREEDPEYDDFKPSQLMPLRGDFYPEQQKARELVK